MNPEDCANCHARPRAGALLCSPCRLAADRLIAETPFILADVLVSGTGPWDLGPLRKPPKRFPWLAVEHGG